MLLVSAALATIYFSSQLHSQVATSEPLLEPDDHLFATVSMPNILIHVITATATMSQQLAEKALQSIPTKEKELIPPYLYDFKDIFTKESFDSLLEQRTWDHTIELEPTAKPSACKVHPLSPSKQFQLDEFLQEHLHTGHIDPLKPPMTSPVLFIKKKDQSLQLIWDYHVLNAMMVKNHYPLPIISEPITQLQGVKYFTKLDM